MRGIVVEPCWPHTTLDGMEFRRIGHGVVDSTNERALAQITEGLAQHGDVHVAVGQTLGRGRRGREWISDAGQGLYMSVVLLPQSAIQPAALTVAAGLALLDLARDVGVVDARLKWPNDLVVGQAKLAGILVETRGLQLDRPHYVIGIGLNVLQESFPDELLAERDVTSLLQLSCVRPLEDVERLLLTVLAERLAQVESAPQQLEQDYPRAARLDGQGICVETAEGAYRGVLEGFDFEHGLTLRTADGQHQVLLEHAHQVHVDSQG